MRATKIDNDDINLLNEYVLKYESIKFQTWKIFILNHPLFKKMKYQISLSNRMVNL